jgi:hypothetical protein
MKRMANGREKLSTSIRKWQVPPKFKADGNFEPEGLTISHFIAF